VAIVRRLDEASVVAALTKEIDLAVFTLNISQSCHKENIIHSNFIIKLQQSMALI